MIKPEISSTAQTILSHPERELRAHVGEFVRHSPLLVSVKGTQQPGRGKKHWEYMILAEIGTGKRSPGLILRYAIAQWCFG